jgi:Arc/MetJ family transcription regulator
VYKEVYEMRTNIVLDDDLLDEAFRYSKAHTKKEVINLALKEFVEHHRRKDLRELRGKIQFAQGYDYKELRKGK